MNKLVAGGGSAWIVLREKLANFSFLIPAAILATTSLLFIRWFDWQFIGFYKSPHNTLTTSVPFAFTIVLAAIFHRQRYSDFAPVLRIALRSTSIGLLAFLIAEPPLVTLANPVFAGGAQYIDTCYRAHRRSTR